MFALTREQLPQTSVVINVFDKDTGNPDDFMGEVVISLASLPGILTRTITQTYSVRPKVPIFITVLRCNFFIFKYDSAKMAHLLNKHFGKDYKYLYIVL